MTIIIIDNYRLKVPEAAEFAQAFIGRFASTIQFTVPFLLFIIRNRNCSTRRCYVKKKKKKKSAHFLLVADLLMGMLRNLTFCEALPLKQKVKSRALSTELKCKSLSKIPKALRMLIHQRRT